MNLTKEEILKLSDEQLTACTAIHIMGWTIRKEHPEKSEDYPYVTAHENGYTLWSYEGAEPEGWCPTTDINDAVRLQEALGDDIYFTEYTANLIDLTGHIGNINIGCVAQVLRLSPRERTIAAIMAVTDEEVSKIVSVMNLEDSDGTK